MLIEKVEYLPEREYGMAGHRRNKVIEDLQNTIPYMEKDAWYVIVECGHYNANDQYRSLCQAARKLGFPINIKMRQGKIYIRRTV